MDSEPSSNNLPELIQQYYALLYRYAFRLSGSEADAEDITQQAFLTAQQKWKQLREPAHAKAWLCTIARNLFLKHRRRERTIPICSLESVAEPAGETWIDSSIDSDELQAVLNQMPEEFRAPLILFYFEEFSYKEIAEQMDVPIGTVMSRLARAKAHVRRRLLLQHSEATHA